MASRATEPPAESSYDASLGSTAIFTPQGSTVSSENDSTRTGLRAPVPNHTYKIVSVTCGRQITLSRGRVILASADESGSAHWACELHNGWLGLRNTASDKLLGHDGGNPGEMRCGAQYHRLFEHLRVIPHTTIDGAYSILTEYWIFGLRSVRQYNEEAVTRLCRNLDDRDPGTAWVFIEL